MRKRTLLTAIALVALGTAAGAAGAGGDGFGGPAPGVAQGWDGVTTPDGKTRYVAMADGSKTLVAAVRTQGGRVVRWGWVEGNWGIPLATYGTQGEGLSRDGRSLLLGNVATLTPQTKRTLFTVVSTKSFRVQKTITLKGAFAYDALSPDLRTLYLIKYLSIAPEIRYEVRAYDLAAGKLVAQPIVDKREPDERMTGQPVTRTTSSNGGWVLTLYASAEHPFIHALDTLHRGAVCIDLPWKNSQAIWKIRLRVAGGQLVLEQPKVGRLATVDMKSWSLTAFRKPQ